MPEIDITSYAAMDPATLESIRRSLVAKAAGTHENLSLEDLHQLAAVTGVLRRRASGPPKVAKVKGERKAPAAKAALEDLA